MKSIHSNSEFLEISQHKKQPQFRIKLYRFQLTVSELLKDNKLQFTISDKFQTLKVTLIVTIIQDSSQE